MDRRIWIGVAILGVVVIAALVAPLFLPKSGQTFDDVAPEGAMGPGSELIGRDGHTASGTVRLVQTGDGYVVRFENISQTQGPDVYLYVTREAHAYDKAAVEDGLRVLLPQGDQGQFTARGNFNVPLPEAFDPAEYKGIATWCDRFGVPFSSAALGPTG